MSSKNGQDGSSLQTEPPLSFAISRRHALLGAAALLAPLSPSALLATPTTTPNAAASSLIRLDSNENPYGPSPKARAAIVASIPEGCRYADADIAPLESALARQEHLDPAHVVLGSGSSELLHIAALLAAEGGAGGELIAADPTFEDIEEFAAKFGVHTRLVPVNKAHQHDLPAMGQLINAQTRLIYVCNPNNPTATVDSRTALEAFIKTVPSHILVLVDEAYIDFVTDPAAGSVAKLIDTYPNLIVIRTFSKLHGLAGLRIGYGFATPALAARLRAKQLAFPNIAVLRAALASLSDDTFLRSTLQSILADRSRVEALVDARGLARAPSQGNFVFFEVRQPITAFRKTMLEHGIRVGRPFNRYDDWCRLTIGTTAEMDHTIAVLADVLPKA